jgi:hypothetical protein
MMLRIKFPENLITEQLVVQEDIPCLCRVSKEFEVVFEDPLPEVTGVVAGWDRKMLEQRAPAGAGGRYTHYVPGRITLRKVEGDEFVIVSLSFFYCSFGWCPILEGNEYATPKPIWDEE